MNHAFKKYLTISASFVLKTLLVAVLILGLGWSLMQLAVWKNSKPVVEANADGTITLTADDATIMGSGGAKANLHAGRRNIGWWDHTSQSLEWRVDVREEGNYRVMLDYALPARMKTDCRLKAGGSSLDFSTGSTGGWAKWDTLEAGTIKLKAAKGQLIQLIPTQIHQPAGVMNFAELRLIPTDE
ncbi:MAG: hypothetical protein H7A51_02170 [Akkermansiaceae bacterium]|nr:hypothetical protein [Akkermansiaceae bacterium]